MLELLPAAKRDEMADWSQEILNISSVVVPVLIISVSVIGDVVAALPIPRFLRDAYRWLASPFRNFLTLADLGETPGEMINVSVLKTRILTVSACLASLSSLASLILQLSLDDQESTFKLGIFFITWLYISFRVGIKPFQTPPYLFAIFAFLYALQLAINIGFALFAVEVQWMNVAWLTLNLIPTGTFLYVAGTYPLKTSLPCGNVAKSHDIPSNALSCPEDDVTLWSWSAFKFVEPLLRLATEKTLGEADIWTLSPYFRHRNLFNKRLEYQARYPTHSLLRFLITSNSLDLFLDLVLELWSAFVGFVPPYALKEILAVLVLKTPEAKRAAYLWAIAAFLANLSFAQVDLFQAWHTRRCYERTRGQLFCAIHYKALRRREVGGKPSTGSGEENFDLGKIVNIMRGDSYAVAQRFWEFSGVCTAPVRLVIALIFLYNILGWSSLVSVAVVMIAWLFNYPLIQWNVSFARSMLKAMDKRMNTVNELLQNIRFLKFYGWENYWSSRAQAARDDELRWRVRSYILETIIGFIWIWTPSATALVAFLCYTLVEGQRLTVSKAFTAISLFSYLQGPMAALPGQIEALLKAYVSMQRIESFLSEGEVPDWASTLTCDLPNPHQQTEDIGFSQATFEWEEPQENSSPSRFRLGPLDFIFPAGKLTLVSGPTGSGKTALLSALLGEMHCLSGTVHVNKTQHRVAYCGQNPWLEHATIRDNIVFSSAYGYDRARYEKVLEACALLPDLRILPAGDLTEIGEKGITLSGGQRSRIALARAMYSQAQCILLDDPLAAVDMHTAQHIVKACFSGSLAENRTIILVTHHITLCLPIASYVVELGAGQPLHHGPKTDLAQQDVLEDIVQAEDHPSITDDDSPTLHMPDLSMVDLNGSGTATPAYFPDSESDSVDGKLIEIEARAEGRVSLSTYMTYIYAAGIACWVLTIFIMLLIRFVNIGNQVFLAKWGEAYEKDNELLHFFLQPVHRFHLHLTYPWDSFPSPDLDVVPWLMVYLWISTAGAISLLLNISLGYYASLRAARSLFSSLLSRITRAPSRFFDTTPIGRILNRFTSDIGTIDGALQNSAKACISGLMDFTTSFITILVVVPRFAPFALFIAWLYIRLAPSYIRASRDLRRLESVALSPAFSGFDELLQGITHIRGFGMEQRYQDRFYQRVDHFQTFDHVYWLINGWLRWRYDCLGSVVVFAATLFALGADISDGFTAIVISQAAQFAEANRQLVKVAAQLELDFNSVERVMEYLNVPQEAPAIIETFRPPAYWPSSSGQLVVDDLVVQYAPHLPPALRKISFTVNPAERIGVIGRTGSGKSTLALSLLRMIEPCGGRILIDGIDISKLGLEDLRTRVTIISQDVSLFSGTIKSNLDPLDQHTPEECLEVMERCHLNSALHFTPTADEPTILDMYISPSSLSAGEKQLAALARAILRRTNIIIMDEATSQIDIHLDDQIQHTVRDELTGSIVITIAHRLRTIIDYDRILVLDDGKVAEFDSPKHLLTNSKSKFRQLCQKSTDWPLFSSLLREWESEDT
ncbi:P-loop containing nucleoside triphosphate hydrolase protein [Macrolepiota fuliginosa MF-IS2]|uniref:P-loop containing nucleoside triphosphate hydrolase protein n=1 Tax=Macrolepiota fuliginosa MF-IS2 TaxID=1400762 RepID=A0A9P5XLF2_9AGAR|nr:P-loop containing nucleoside triphosphate hydrolase protein [Macrolepiota fuliginosa MF-IS2]